MVEGGRVRRAEQAVILVLEVFDISIMRNNVGMLSRSRHRSDWGHVAIGRLDRFRLTLLPMVRLLA